MWKARRKTSAWYKFNSFVNAALLFCAAILIASVIDHQNSGAIASFIHNVEREISHSGYRIAVSTDLAAQGYDYKVKTVWTAYTLYQAEESPFSAPFFTTGDGKRFYICNINGKLITAEVEGKN